MVFELFSPNQIICFCYSTVGAVETEVTAEVVVEADLMMEVMTGPQEIGGQDHQHLQGMTVDEKIDMNHQETEVNITIFCRPVLFMLTL